MEVRQLKYGKSASKILMFTRSSRQNKYHHNASFRSLKLSPVLVHILMFATK